VATAYPINANNPSYDYTKGKLGQLVDIIIESGAKLFVSAVGVPPQAVVDKLHAHGILYMNMIGHPKHVKKCLELGVDIICAQGGEGGGHTGDVPTTLLIPTVVQLVKGKTSPMTGKPVQVIAAGGIFNGQSLAAALMLGASAVWVGTRFVLSEEAGAPRAHQEAVRTSGFDDNVRTIIFTVGLFCHFMRLLILTGPPAARAQQPVHPELGGEPPGADPRADLQGQDPRRVRHGDARRRH
jgi:NAD(P)H-dependent flavin oxidoreductase YrpB (nitropropane dioxygenase family)